MNPARCPNCDRSEVKWNHEHFTKGCAQCDLRKLAFARAFVREAALDHVERHIGPRAAHCLREKLQLECARIKFLKGTK